MKRLDLKDTYWEVKSKRLSVLPTTGLTLYSRAKSDASSAVRTIVDNDNVNISKSFLDRDPCSIQFRYALEVLDLL